MVSPSRNTASTMVKAGQGIVTELASDTSIWRTA